MGRDVEMYKEEGIWNQLGIGKKFLSVKYKQMTIFLLAIMIFNAFYVLWPQHTLSLFLATSIQILISLFYKMETET